MKDLYSSDPYQCLQPVGIPGYPLYPCRSLLAQHHLHEGFLGEVPSPDLALYPYSCARGGNPCISTQIYGIWDSGKGYLHS